MVSWRINSTKLSNKEKLNKMKKSNEQAETKPCTIHGVSNSCLICGKKLDAQTAKQGNGTCSEYCNAKYSGYPMPSDYSEGLQKLINNCC